MDRSLLSVFIEARWICSASGGFSAVMLLGACGIRGEDLPRQEVVERIRAIGLKPSVPVFTLPASASDDKYADAVMYAVSPHDADATIETWTISSPVPGATLLPTSAITLTSGLMTRERKGALFLNQAPVRAKIPFARKAGGARFAFGLKLHSQGKEEKVVASFLAHPAGAPELSWTLPALTVSAPTNGGKLKAGEDARISLTASVTQAEDLFVGWFVSSGEIYNRNRRATYWRPEDEGRATVIATVRGASSLAFDFRVVEVEVDTP